jgi:hypothetical protein
MVHTRGGGEGKIKHKESGFLQGIGFHLLVNILCNQNGEEPYLLSKQKEPLSFLIGNSISALSEVNVWFFFAKLQRLVLEKYSSGRKEKSPAFGRAFSAHRFRLKFHGNPFMVNPSG